MFATGLFGVTYLFRQLSVTEHNGDQSSSVEVSAQIERMSNGSNSQQSPLDVIGAAGIGRMGGSLAELDITNYYPTIPLNPGLQGNASAANLFGCYLQSP